MAPGCRGRQRAGAAYNHRVRPHSHPRLHLNAPPRPWLRAAGIPWWHVQVRHGGDEYGNCSWRIESALLGEAVWFTRRHFQRDVLVPDEDQYPDPAERAAAWREWYDRRYNSGSSVIS
jgi:hypothetical protein